MAEAGFEPGFILLRALPTHRSVSVRASLAMNPNCGALKIELEIKQQTIKTSQLSRSETRKPNTEGGPEILSQALRSKCEIEIGQREGWEDGRKSPEELGTFCDAFCGLLLGLSWASTVFNI